MEMETARDPFALFAAWMAEAALSEPNDPNAMTLATATPDGAPSARIVLLKEADPRGFVFYSHLNGRKGSEIADNPRAALCFHWKTLGRQVRVEGTTEPVEADEANAYFASRARVSRLGAWASRQSRPLENRTELEERVAKFDARYPDEIPRPEHWSGTRVVPARIEFWHDRPFRLHDRIVFERAADRNWRTHRLYP